MESRTWAVITSPMHAVRLRLPSTPIIFALRAPVLSATASMVSIWIMTVESLEVGNCG
jgi:hypothetical protein